jgi:glycosyltransferase involved in cell wall biosynthesis
MSGTVKVSEDARELSSLKPVVLGPLPGRPLVSILISNYNYGEYLNDAIESVLRQSYRNLEIVICDDGSTDASLNILERYEAADSRIKVVRQSNSGQSLALNTAFYNCAGEIVCLLDADDVFLPNKVRLVVNAFVESPSSGFAVHKMLLVDKNRKYLGGIPCLYDLPSGWQGTLLNSSGPCLLPGLPPTSGLSLRRSAAEVFFPLPAALKAYSDTLIQVIAPLVTPIVAINLPLSEYRVHGGNIGGVSRFTESRLRSIVLYEREIWSAWRRYACSAVPSDFPLPEERAPSLMDYAYARYRSDDNFVKTYEAIPLAYMESLPWPLRWFWRASIIFPGWLFRRSFDFAYGQTRLKMMARRVLNAWRNSQRAREQVMNSWAAR